MLIHVLGAPEDGGVSWLEESSLRTILPHPAPQMETRPARIKRYIEHLLALVARRHPIGDPLVPQC